MTDFEEEGKLRLALAGLLDGEEELSVAAFLGGAEDFPVVAAGLLEG